MDKLIANASVGLAKASMNRRGFLGRLARAAGGAAVLTAGLATVARADHCEGSHRCLSECSAPYDGDCDWHNCGGNRNRMEECKVVDCYTGEYCGYTSEHRVGCSSTTCP